MLWVNSLACHEVKGRVDGKVADEAEAVDGTLLINGHLQDKQQQHTCQHSVAQFGYAAQSLAGLQHNLLLAVQPTTLSFKLSCNYSFM